MNAQPDPQRTIAELKELRALTGDENGAQRVAFTTTWLKARAWLREKLQSLPLEVATDAAGNVWATLRGKSPRALLIGGHIDSVPNGGWLDGCLNVLAGVEILRRLNQQYRGQPPVMVRLVDWATLVAGSPELLAADAVHGTPEGYERRAEETADAIRGCPGT